MRPFLPAEKLREGWDLDVSVREGGVGGWGWTALAMEIMKAVRKRGREMISGGARFVRPPSPSMHSHTAAGASSPPPTHPSVVAGSVGLLGGVCPFSQGGLVDGADRRAPITAAGGAMALSEQQVWGGR